MTIRSARRSGPWPGRRWCGRARWCRPAPSSQRTRCPSSRARSAMRRSWPRVIGSVGGQDDDGQLRIGRRSARRSGRRRRSPPTVRPPPRSRSTFRRSAVHRPGPAARPGPNGRPRPVRSEASRSDPSRSGGVAVGSVAVGGVAVGSVAVGGVAVGGVAVRCVGPAPSRRPCRCAHSSTFSSCTRALHEGERAGRVAGLTGAGAHRRTTVPSSGSSVVRKAVKVLQTETGSPAAAAISASATTPATRRSFFIGPSSES